jgi:hypothetical protein
MTPGAGANLDGVGRKIYRLAGSTQRDANLNNADKVAQQQQGGSTTAGGGGGGDGT